MTQSKHSNRKALGTTRWTSPKNESQKQRANVPLALVSRPSIPNANAAAMYSRRLASSRLASLYSFYFAFILCGIKGQTSRTHTSHHTAPHRRARARADNPVSARGPLCVSVPWPVAPPICTRTRTLRCPSRRVGRIFRYILVHRKHRGCQLIRSAICQCRG